MKIESIKTDYNRGIVRQRTVEILSFHDEIIQLINALAVIEKWKKETFHALNFDPTNSDWHMSTFEIDGSKVVKAVITDGACG